MTKPAVNIADIELQPRHLAFAATGTGSAAEINEARSGRVSTQMGAQQLGYNLTVVPPGKCAFLARSHLVNEDMFFILSGAGGIDTAHQIANTGIEELRYLAVRTTRTPAVCEYPNSGKFGIFARIPMSAEGVPRVLMVLGREGQSLDYWHGE